MITVITLNRKFYNIAISKYSFLDINFIFGKIEDYTPMKHVVLYVSPANSFGFMDGGIEYILSRILFPDIEKEVKKSIQIYGKETNLGRKYLPIGSSFIVKTNQPNTYLVCAPTMLFPQDVSKTSNCYYATMATLYNLFEYAGYREDYVEVIFTSMCCGWGAMDEEESLKQFIKGVQNYKNYKPVEIGTAVLLEPNLDEQPNTYANREFKNIDINDITIV